MKRPVDPSAGMTKSQLRAWSRRQGEEMLDAFASVGVQRLHVILTDIYKKRRNKRSDWTVADLRPGVEPCYTYAEFNELNVIVRPYSDKALLIQLDDLDAVMVERLKAVAFLVICTSPYNFQVWVAVSDGNDEFMRRLKEGVGSDVGASGATRMSGSLNIKPQFKPYFPRVWNVHLSRGLIVRRADLQAMGLVAPVPPPLPIPSPPCGPFSPGRPRRFPNYSRCLHQAPKRADGKTPDRSRADFAWCCMALEWGWDERKTTAELMRLSDKAREKGEAYALATVRRAAARTGTTGGGT